MRYHQFPKFLNPLEIRLDSDITHLDSVMVELFLDLRVSDLICDCIYHVAILKITHL